jgi:hypothetical protein
MHKVSTNILFNAEVPAPVTTLSSPASGRVISVLYSSTFGNGHYDALLPISFDSTNSGLEDHNQMNLLKNWGKEIKTLRYRKEVVKLLNKIIN